MRKVRGTALAVVAFALVLVAGLAEIGAPRAGERTAHDFSFEAIEGGPLPLSGFAGKAVLVVNTASLCGFTPQYEGLQGLWEAYRERGLVVLGVPSNDFGGQEPGSEAEIKGFCEVNFGIDFPLTAKVSVKGPAAHPLYRWLALELGEESQPRWNFHKYLLDPEGRAVAWFPTRVEPGSADLREAVERALPAPQG